MRQKLLQRSLTVELVNKTLEIIMFLTLHVVGRKERKKEGIFFDLMVKLRNNMYYLVVKSLD